MTSSGATATVSRCHHCHGRGYDYWGTCPDCLGCGDLDCCDGAPQPLVDSGGEGPEEKDHCPHDCKCGG